MGWWDAGILGGDTPWDAIGNLERVVGWDSCDGEEGFLSVVEEDTEYDTEELSKKFAALREKAIACVNTREHRKKLIEYFLDLDPKKQFIEILTCAYAFVSFNFKLTQKMEALVKSAIPYDHKDWDEREDRVMARNDLLRRMDIAAGRAPSLSQFTVHLTKCVEGALKIEVTAPTALAAQKAAEKLAKYMKPDRPDLRITVREVLEVK